MKLINRNLKRSAPPLIFLPIISTGKFRVLGGGMKRKASGHQLLPFSPPLNSLLPMIPDNKYLGSLTKLQIKNVEYRIKP